MPPLGGNVVEQACWALGCMAYTRLRDLVALASCSGQEWSRISPEMPGARAQLSTQARAFVDELAQVCIRHGLALGTYDANADLVVGPLTEDALDTLRGAFPGAARCRKW